jgi:hypothetical protein
MTHNKIQIWNLSLNTHTDALLSLARKLDPLISAMDASAANAVAIDRRSFPQRDASAQEREQQFSVNMRTQGITNPAIATQSLFKIEMPGRDVFYHPGDHSKTGVCCRVAENGR